MGETEMLLLVPEGVEAMANMCGMDTTLAAAAAVVASLQGVAHMVVARVILA